jgi:hypothetical protein
MGQGGAVALLSVPGDGVREGVLEPTFTGSIASPIRSETDLEQGNP